jgi:hypothetical protein
MFKGEIAFKSKEIKMDDKIQNPGRSKRGGARPGAGRKKSACATPPSGNGRGGTRPGAGRPFKNLGAGDRAAIVAAIELMVSPAKIDELFAEARSGNLGAVRRLSALFEKAAETALKDEVDKDSRCPTLFPEA